MLLVCLSGFGARAELSAATDDWSYWKEARAFYDAGRYDDALQALLTQPTPQNSSYFYNIGTIYYRLGRAGTALAYFEKANRLAPHDAEIRHNLALARKLVEASAGADRLDPASNGLEKLSDRIDLDEVRGTVGLLGLILFLFWIRTYVKTRSLSQTFLKPGSILVFLAFAITGALYLAQQVSELRPPAVLIERQAIRSGPGDRFVELGQAEAGTKVRLLGPAIAASDTQNNSAESAARPGELWRQIRFSREGIGWIPSSSLLLL
ncbi:MAG: hypothetical protein A2070_09915 [Bdellovibrionales bacterium GWC1_52_8]|nr:MAG: hypothetical protein A2Z97_05740 [Bdellovibrionales bacterium GWB1_52_6]OFZ38573.1 MAG: hypothetical protein A2070_09915 [Bdellovibrionales bacterium GWC1_52_8]